jgi:hypothetical protein
MYTSSSKLKWDLIDQDDPIKGISLTYPGGDTCVLAGKNVTREFTIQFTCSNSYGRDPDARVKEDLCHYGIEFPTIFGCPLECPFSNRKLCSGQGVCAMDTDAGGPRCFCDDGFDGRDCSYVGKAPVESSCSGFCVALVFIVIIMGGLLVAGGFLYYRVWKLAKLNVRFGNMTSSFIKSDDMDSETFSLTAAANKVKNARHV